ncbi:MAG TPA: helix-turn-helix transcriptional regulator [Actinocrinis sp.]|jgi:transcriptional regulator with XRE-family HTH domain
MTGGMSPVVRGRRLAAALRRLRLASGRTVEDVALHLECSAAKISRIENNLVTVRIQDARDLLDLYEVDDEERERLLGLVRDARKRAWWFQYADLLEDGFDKFIKFEDEAVDIWVLEARLIPGLLQTESYATSMMTSRRDAPSETADRYVRLRMDRQKVLAQANPPAMHVLLDEAALRRRVAPPDVMAGQYRHLISAAGAPNISVRILPLDVEPQHQAPGFSFQVFGFADPADPRVAFEEVFDGSVFHESAESVGRYMAAFEQACTCTLDDAASVRFLAALAQQTE